MEQEIWKQVLHKLDKIEAGQQKLEAEVSKLKTGQQKLEAEIADIKKDTELIAFIKQAVSELSQEGITTNKKIQQLQETVQEHKTSLDILAARSIEQESRVRIMQSR